MRRRAQAKDDEHSNESVTPPSSDDEAEVLEIVLYNSYSI